MGSPRVLLFILSTLSATFLLATPACAFGFDDRDARPPFGGDYSDAFGADSGGFHTMQIGGPPPRMRLGLGGLLNALLNGNSQPRPALEFVPMQFHIRGGKHRDPFEAGEMAARQAEHNSIGNLFGFPDGAHIGERVDRKVYPFPQDCEAEIKGKCSAIIRICEGGVGRCTLECETDHPPKVSEKCKKKHPCAPEVERLCPIMSDRHTIFKCLLDHARKPSSNISSACRASEPCLKNETSPNCDTGGVGKHVFEPGKGSNKLGGAFKEKHPTNPACSCKSDFLGFSGCGAHMTHPFCLPCGPNCVRNPACGSGASWCEVTDADKCPEAQLFSEALEKTEGLATISRKTFPESLRKSRAGYRECKRRTDLSMGSFMKDLFGDLEDSLQDPLEDDNAALKPRKQIGENDRLPQKPDYHLSGSSSGSSKDLKKIDKDIAAERKKLEEEKAALEQEEKLEKDRETKMTELLSNPKSALNTLDEVKFKEWERKVRSSKLGMSNILPGWLGICVIIGLIVLGTLVVSYYKRSRG